jgi:hypothetical protein
LEDIINAIGKNQASRDNAIDALLASLKRATPDEVRSVKSLLRPFLLSTRVNRHCVRCHKYYDESENSDESCEVGHIAMRDVEDEVVFNGMYREQLMEYTCCNEHLTEGEADEKAVCYTERHTTDPQEVEYTDEDDYADCLTVFEKNFVNTCRDEGCPGASDSEDDDEEEDGN